MKIAERVSRIRSKPSVFRSSTDQLAMLGEIELAARDPFPPGSVFSLIRNTHFLYFAASTSWIVVRSINIMNGHKIDLFDSFGFVSMLFISIVSGRRLFSRRLIPKFAVCEHGLWINPFPAPWEMIHDCSWNRFRRNELVVSLVHAKVFVQIPPDQTEAFETAIHKHGKMCKHDYASIS